MSFSNYFITAVKCNDLKPVLKIVADMGLSFDCASQVNFNTFQERSVESK
jgi:diaminopimelate decarboxylase